MAERLGIIGAGQLGAYLCQFANQMGIESRVLCHDTISPGVALATDHVTAPYDDEAAARWLCENSDVVTFEFEDVPDNTLRYLEEQTDALVFPRPETLLMLKNKARQKTWLAANGFPTSEFVVCDDGADLAELQTKFGERFVQKAQTGGIDGQGVQVINADNSADLWQQPTLVEAFVPHVRELAVLVVRGRTGAAQSFPIVELRFCSETNVLLVANSPARVSAEVEAAAKSLGEQVIEKMDGVGVFAIELFETASGDLLVNEISPRVHNSGHMTIEAHQCNQYEQHIRAVLGHELGSTLQNLPGAMTNLLYRDTIEDFVGRPFSAWPDQNAAVTVHWYGKTAAREGRKMGHVTSVAETLELAVSQVAEVSKRLGFDVDDAL